MTIQELEFLLTKFDETKRYVNEGYYRLRGKKSGTYEMAYLYADACGTTTVHPQITLEVDGKKITPMLLIDLGSTPTKHVSYTKETAAELDHALKNLTEKFYEASKYVA